MNARDRLGERSMVWSAAMPAFLGISVPTVASLSAFLFGMSWLYLWAIAAAASLSVLPVVMLAWRGCGRSYLLRVLFVMTLGPIATYGKGNAVGFSTGLVVAYFSSFGLSIGLMLELILSDLKSMRPEIRR